MDQKSVEILHAAASNAELTVQELELPHAFRREVRNADGGLLRIEFWTLDKAQLTTMWVHYPDALLTLEPGEGLASIERWEDDTIVGEGLPEFPANTKIRQLKFRLKNLGFEAPQKPTFDAVDIVYLDADEEVVDGDGNPTDTRPEWLAALERGEELPEDEARDGAWATYHDDDTPQLEAIYAAGELQSLTWSNEAGEIMYERTYGDTEVVRLFGEEGKLTYTRTPTGRSLLLESWTGEELFRGEQELRPLETAEDFVEACAFYADLTEHFDYRALELDVLLGLGNFDLEVFDVRREDEFFNVAVVAEDGAGESLIVIEEPGEYDGRVFMNFHDEGLYDIETIDNYVEGWSDEALADRNGVIADMPFVQFGVADNLTDLFALIDLVPHEEPDFDSMGPARYAT